MGELLNGIEMPTSWIGLLTVLVIVGGWVLVNRQRKIKSDVAETRTTSAATKDQLQNGQTTNFRQEFDASNRRQEKRLSELLEVMSEMRGDVKSIHSRVERLENQARHWWQHW